MFEPVLLETSRQKMALEKLCCRLLAITVQVLIHWHVHFQFLAPEEEDVSLGEGKTQTGTYFVPNPRQTPGASREARLGKAEDPKGDISPNIYTQEWLMRSKKSMTKLFDHAQK